MKQKANSHSRHTSYKTVIFLKRMSHCEEAVAMLVTVVIYNAGHVLMKPFTCKDVVDVNPHHVSWKLCKCYQQFNAMLVHKGLQILQMREMSGLISDW